MHSYKNNDDLPSVIVIDDDIDSVNIMSQYLKIQGINVVGTGINGKDAFELYKKYHPDVVITDMKMPDFDGAYAIKMIKSYDPNAKIIVVTGYTDYEFQKYEVVAILKKPYNISELVEKINLSVRTTVRP